MFRLEVIVPAQISGKGARSNGASPPLLGLPCPGSTFDQLLAPPVPEGKAAFVPLTDLRDGEQLRTLQELDELCVDNDPVGDVFEIG